MSAGERWLVVGTAILVAARIVLCWGSANVSQSFSGSGADPGIPWSFMWMQIASTVASVFALVGLASAAGLLFLRAARWTSSPAADEEPTPEPSP